MNKEAFSQSKKETKAFEKLDEAMCTTLILETPNFTKTFIVECDASSHGICIILMQKGRSLAFEIIKIKGKNLLNPIYEKEMLTTLHAVRKWHT